MERACRFSFLSWMLSFLSVITAASWHPPMITKFIQKDLVNPNDVKYDDRPYAFELPCEASGTNLTWKWKHNDTEITTFNDRPYFLSDDGTLTGNHLAAEHSGSYQCFVKDEKTGIEVFSRKLKVAVTVLGEFIDRKDVEKKVDLGESFQVQCPKHTASFGAVFSWVGKQSIHLSRDARRGISPDGELFVTYITQQDIDEINGIKCHITAGNSYEESKPLKLEKNNPQQTDSPTSRSPSWADVPAAEEFAIEGRSKTLYCFANGRPEPQITWKKNGQQIIHGQNSFEISHHYYGRRLIITNVNKTTHQDVYTCEANNSQSNGQPLIHTTSLMVKVAPRWTENAPPRKNINIVIGRSETLECNVMADPEASFKWYKNGIPLQSSSARLRVDGNKLHLTDVNLTADGVYQCAAENKHGMIVSATWVQVMAWKPSFADGQFGPFSLIHDSQGRLQCKPSAEPRPTFQWFRNGVLISYGINSRYMLQLDGTLLIKKVDKDKDSVNYTCKAENMLGQDSATTVPVVYVRPRLITKPRNQKVLEKDTVTFHCDASGNPTPSITWVKDGKTVSTGNTLQFETTRYQSGRYWCRAENGLNVTVEASADLNVQFLPVFTRRPTDQTVKEGDAATFYCTATGNPTPRITWLKDGKTVATGDTLSFVAFDKQSGKYWCSAENGLGLAINTSAYLDVQFPPQLITKPRDQTVDENETVKFQCTATGNPTPNITWSKDGKTVGTGSELTFVALRGHTGRYWCSADNVLSAGVKANAYLRVLYVPSPPSNVTITKCDEWTAKLSWIPGPYNDIPLTHYLIEQQLNANPVVFRLLYNVTNSSATNVSLKLSRGSVLRFRVRAVNGVGKSRPSSTVETTCTSIETNKGALKVTESPIYHKAWFLTLLVLVAYVLLSAMLAVLYRNYYKRKGVKYEVAKREKKRGCKDEGTQAEESIGDEDANSLVGDAGNKPTEENQHRSSRPLSTYSLFEIQFREDGSFTEEYGEQDEMILQQLQGTFV